MKRKALIIGLAVCLLALALPASQADDATFVSPVKQALVKSWYLSALKDADLEPDQLSVHSIGQSHIDAAWRWRLSQTHTKCIRTFRRALKHIDKFPEFYFTQSSPQFFEWVMEDDPELFQEIVAAEKAGRFEIVGGMWIEPDCNMPDGESFVRHRLYGQRFYLEHFGHMSDISWALDSFGYNWNMPQIMVKSGARYMWTSKLTWNDTTIFPFHLFYWQSPDGTKILTHICPISPLPIWFPTGEIKKYKSTRYLLKPGSELVANYATDPSEIEAAISDEFMGEIGIFYGLGDGGHGPLRPEIKTQLAFEKQGYGKLATAHELFNEFDKYSDRIPTWNDEMYLEFHRGVQTTHAWIKRANRLGEQMMRSAEVLSTAAMLAGNQYPQGELTRTWKILLLNHFHDILPGSSVPEVYDDARVDHAQIQKTAARLLDDALSSIASAIDTRIPDRDLIPLVVFNTLSWPRTDIARLDISGPPSGDFKVFDENENQVPAQKDCRDGKCQLCFLAEDIPPIGYRVFYMKKGEASLERGVRAEEIAGEMVIENELLRVKIDKTTGWLSSLLDKSLEREMLAGKGNELMAFNDRPNYYSAWNIGRDYLEHQIPMPYADKIEITDEGPLFARVKVKRTFQKTEIVQEVTLYRESPLLHLDIWLDFHETDTLIKQGFDTSIKGHAVAADIPYAVIERPTHPGTEAEKARWEMPCQKWIDLSDREAGLALLNNGKYGFSLNHDGTGYRLSIIRGAHYPKAMPLAHDVRHHIITPTGITDQGEHRARTALYPHAGDWKDARLWQAGYEFNTPLEVIEAEPCIGTLPYSASLFSLDNNDVYIGSIKKAEDNDDVVIRLIEATGRKQKASVKVYKDLKIKDAFETDLLEFNPERLSFNSDRVNIEIEPFEIKTIKLSLE